MRIDLPMCNFKNCHWCQDGNCVKKTMDHCEYHWQNTEIERLQDIIKELQQYNEAWVEDNGKLRKEMKSLKTDTVRKMQSQLTDASEFAIRADSNGAMYCVDHAAWVEEVAKELLEENK